MGNTREMDEMSNNDRRHDNPQSHTEEFAFVSVFGESIRRSEVMRSKDWETIRSFLERGFDTLVLCKQYEVNGDVEISFAGCLSPDISISYYNLAWNDTCNQTGIATWVAVLRKSRNSLPPNVNVKSEN